MHSIKRFIKGPSTILFAGVYECIFQLEIFVVDVTLVFYMKTSGKTSETKMAISILKIDPKTDKVKQTNSPHPDPQ